MSEVLFRKLALLARTDERFAADFRAIEVEEVAFGAGERMIGATEAYNAVYLVESGWVIRARHLPDGARQIVSVALSGDFIGLNALMFDTADFDHVCRTPVTALRFVPAVLRGALDRHPAVGRALFWVTAQEETILAERVVSLGRRPASARAAHAIAELLARVEMLAEERVDSLAVPLTQEDFADLLGISAVHANKVLRGLHRNGVVTFRNGTVEVHDRASLEALAGFEPGYLRPGRSRYTGAPFE